MKYIFTSLAAILIFSATTHAAEFSQPQLATSNIAFQYKQMGVSMDGKFKKFTVQLSFDPEQLKKTKATLDVELASVDAGSSEADEEVIGKSWFNTKTFPVAHFVSTSVKHVQGNHYEMTGKLTIKAKTQDLVVPVTFTSQGKSGVFDGGFIIRRGDFNIGEGAWSKFDIIANDITVKFRITATTGK